MTKQLTFDDHGPTAAEPSGPCTLFYAPDGFAWIRYGALDAEETRPDASDLATDDSPQGRFATLQAAYTAAARAGHRPTRWINPAVGVPMALDHAEHICHQAGALP